MATYQKRSNRKPSGGRFKKLKIKKFANIGRQPRFTKIDERKSKIIRGRSGDEREVLLATNMINVYDKKDKKHKKVKIETVVDSPANRNFVRRNIMTKGSVVKTSLGNVKVTSRPGQAGSLEGVLI